MTDEELDEARLEEAKRIWDNTPHTGASAISALTADWIALRAARLAREGWTPPPPADPLLVEARKIIVDAFQKIGWSTAAKKAADGTEDNHWISTIAMAALKRGIELGEDTTSTVMPVLGEAMQACAWILQLRDRISPAGRTVTIAKNSPAHRALDLAISAASRVALPALNEPVQQPWKDGDEVLVKGRIVMNLGADGVIGVQFGNGGICLASLPEWLVRP